MAGKDNLKVPSSDEARKNGKKGGIASGKARREKKALKETLEELLTMPLKNGTAVDLDKIQSIAELKGKNISMQEAIMLAMLNKAVKGDVKAATFVRDTLGQKLDAKHEDAGSDALERLDLILEGVKANADPER